MDIKSLSGDELIILRTLRALQNGHTEVARSIIARLIAGNLGRTFCRAGESYVDSLDAAELKLSQISRLSLVSTRK